MSQIDKLKITQFCRILGVHVSADLSDLKAARNRLVKLYHPDKNHNISSEAKQALQSKFNIVQEAYNFLQQHYEEIKQMFKHLDEFSLTSKCHPIMKSHWIYAEVASM